MLLILYSPKLNVFLYFSCEHWTWALSMLRTITKRKLNVLLLWMHSHRLSNAFLLTPNRASNLYWKNYFKLLWGDSQCWVWKIKYSILLQKDRKKNHTNTKLPTDFSIKIPLLYFPLFEEYYAQFAAENIIHFSNPIIYVQLERGK